MNRNNVILYYKDGCNPLGSDYTIITELKTVQGIQNRYNEHNKRMLYRGCDSYIVVPYHAWWKTHDVNTLINKYHINKLEVI